MKQQEEIENQKVLILAQFFFNIINLLEKSFKKYYLLNNIYSTNINLNSLNSIYSTM